MEFEATSSAGRLCAGDFPQGGVMADREETRQGTGRPETERQNPNTPNNPSNPQKQQPGEKMPGRTEPNPGQQPSDPNRRNPSSTENE
jgi:hypothetical protein